MSNSVLINAQIRNEVGKGASRSLRNNGKIPAIVYGEKKDPLSVNVESKEYKKLLNQPGVYSRLIDLSIEGKSSTVLTKEIQFHPVSENPLHVDFLRIGEGSSVTVSIPVKFQNEELSPGLKSGGVLNIVRHELELICLASAIPPNILINLDNLNIGDSVKISSVELPEGVKPTIIDRDFTIATIAAPTAIVEPETSSEEETEEETTEETTEATEEETKEENNT